MLNPMTNRYDRRNVLKGVGAICAASLLRASRIEGAQQNLQLAGRKYLWGRDILVAPVVEKGATSRRLYLPRGRWFDFWTNERFEGGREIERTVDLETLPLFVREGAILPLGPVKQYANEKVEGPLTITIYPGADGEFLLYEDDGISFNHRKGDWMGVRLKWSDAQRALAMRLAPGSHLRPPMRRSVEVKLGDAVKNVEFDGHPLDVRFS